jgi:regulator of protease activity HflC (stomatin/prohibitin superfamily)
LSESTGSIIATTFVGGIIIFGLWGCPQYQVYSSKMAGEAQLAHAEYSKKVQVQDALGKLEAAKSLAAAEVERARGISQANQIIGDSLKGHEEYLRWLYIEGLKDNPAEKTIVYIPTEAGLPILEATRNKK